MNRHEEGLPDVRKKRPAGRAVDPDTQRTLPHSAGAEKGVLGSMLTGGPDAIEEAQASIAVDAFYIPAHQTLFETMVSLHSCGQVVDLVTYTQQLLDHELLEKVGGAPYVTELFTFVLTAANLRYYLDIVRSKWLARQMIATCTQAVRRAYEVEREDDGSILAPDQSGINQALDELQSNVIELNNLLVAKDPLRHVSEFVPEAKAQIIAAYKNRGRVTGLPTGFVDFDRMTNGLENGYLYVFGARPAMGKTSWILGLAEYIAVANAAQGNAVGIFSLEMTGVQLARRMICAAASVSIANLRYGFLERQDLPNIEKAAERLIRSHVIIDDKAGLNIFEFRAGARRLVKKRGAKVILIDYLQMMRGVSRRARDNKQAEISEIIQGIAETAKELQVPIVVLAQLNRDVEKTKWGIPEMSHLRESGDIENYAHLIGLLWRPEYYVANRGDEEKEKLCQYLGKMMATPEDRLPSTGEVPDDFVAPIERLNGYAQIIIAKQREGATGPCSVRFVKEYARFESVTSKLFSNNPEERQQTAEPGDG